MTAIEYIKQKGLDYRTQSGQVVLKRCPFCGDAGRHFYIEPGEDGLYFCHKCQEKGNLMTLQKHLGDYEQQRTGGNGYGPPRKHQATIKKAFPPKTGVSKGLDEKMATEPHISLLGDEEALRYLIEERRLTQETIKTFKLGLQVDPDGTQWIAIPHFQKGRLINIKSRTLPPAEKGFRRVKDCPSILFNGDCIEGVEEIFICEGEFDTLTLLQEYTQNAIGVTVGADTFDPTWIDQLAAVKKIYLCYDPDEAGQKGAREAARRLGYDRCFNVVLPNGQDVNEFFRAHSFTDFRNLIDGARQFDISGIISLDQGFEKFKAELIDPEAATGLMTPWPSVNRRIETGFQPGELVILSAPPKIGKSTWALQFCTHNALRGIPSLFFCLEMRPMKVIKKIIQCQARNKEPRLDDIQHTEYDFIGKPLYLGYCYQKPDLNGIIETVKAAIQRYGLKVVVFDHLHYLVRSITNQTQEISLAVQDFKFLAEEMEIPFILIAQPRKIQADSIMTAMDLKDSISIYSDCDHLIILHRKRKASTGMEVAEDMETPDQAFEPMTLVRLEASRYNAGGEALLYYHGEYSRFDEIDLHRN